MTRNLPPYRHTLLASAISCIAFGVPHAHATLMEEEAAGVLGANDSFATAQAIDASLFAIGTTNTLNGRLSQRFSLNYDAKLRGQLLPDTVSVFELPLARGRSFVAAIDNTPGNGPVDAAGSTARGPDTVASSYNFVFNPSFDFDDDSSPLGDGTASQIVGRGAFDDVARIGVAGKGTSESTIPQVPYYGGVVEGVGGDATVYSPAEWWGPEASALHTESGDFDLYVKFDTNDPDDLLTPQGEVDFFRFTGLTPGALFRVESNTGPEWVEFDESGSAYGGGYGDGYGGVSTTPASAPFDTLLGVFDSSGALISSDNDSAFRYDPRVLGIVPDSGELTVAVSGSTDRDFTGDHKAGTDYALEFELLDPASSEHIILPDGCADAVCGDGVFKFNFVIPDPAQAFLLDPPVVAGYDYLSNTINFADLQLPTIGDDIFTVIYKDASGNDITRIIAAGELLDFGPGGVSAFSVRGIETSANLDPTDATAFVASVHFVSAGIADLTQTAYTVDVDPVAASVPEPGTLGLGLVGISGLLAAARRRVSFKRS